VVCGSGLLLLPLANDTLAILACIVITGFGYGPMPNLLFRMGQGMAGPAVAGRWVGLQSGVGNLAGVTGPIITGLIVDSMGYGPAFVVTAAIMATGVMVFALTVPRLDQINWRAAA
jgi:ACS family D-galactonate transporter-like MFS transporter